MGRGEKKAGELLVFLDLPGEIRRYLYPTNRLERLAQEMKRETEVVETFSTEEAVKKLV